MEVSPARRSGPFKIPHPVPMEKWRDTHIKRQKNELTGYYEGEDGAHDDPKYKNHGYRKMRVLKNNPEPLIVAPDSVESRSNFDGFDEYGNPFNADKVLPGGVEGGIQVVREAAVHFLDLAAKILRERFDNEVRIVLLDGFESYIRQSAGYTRSFKQLLREEGAEKPSHTQFYDLGKKANNTYAWVKLDTSASEYLALKKELSADTDLMREIMEIAVRDTPQGDSLENASKIPAKMKSILEDIITISANSKMGPAADRRLKFDYKNNAHAGGAAVDIMFIDNKTNKLLSLTPYPWIGEEAGIDYMEEDGNFDKYVTLARIKPSLQIHLREIGYPTVDDFRWNDWVRLREMRRIRWHLGKALGVTIYSADNISDPTNTGGEDWHNQVNTILYGPDGSVVWRANTADEHPDSSNACGTIQILGPNAIAVYEGEAAHADAQENFGLELPEAA
ncbi:MAG: hypothetical protein AAB588_05425 [Patescibacteria group bacterium]